MRGRAKPPPAPLPQRDGIDPVRVRLPEDPGGEWATVRDHLLARFAGAIGADRVDAMFAEGRFVSVHGPVAPDEPYTAGRFLWFHRDFAPEEPVPFPVGVVYHDARLVIADKPHFLATTPRGRHITETAVARLRRELGLPSLQPAHRLDRLTAGLVLFVVRPEDRGAYQTLFRDKLVRKEYEAVAPYDPSITFPRTVRSRIVKERGVIAAREEPGEANSESRIELLEHREGLGRYRLLPTTGRTHQLRVHMNALGLPLVHDPVYPVIEPEGAADDWTRPLQLLARVLEFTDPVTGGPRRFESGLRLSAWPDR
ncbi:MULTISPECIES: pseudouridine synthase [unclassified Streptomyces]|uniref:pseudouridine synthase n=1 Tax=unclassified Streptomyces TaxID=2593676 RepID=UPI00088BDFC4|nr:MULTISPECIES: pseudouridine synthase [unclassified Streptomyces]MDX3765367.1 pseudouridine synthase [Streptomyces sp. AK08-01B]MDX3814946.1 pseudouridine synthase [Streptomyces sp. AK08-01A]SCY93306.1 tRNA pseudouridine32 synthase / 23S rRNA pseudouridine746 synthase [Streptomyces sp. 136MFCol5.1]